MERITNEYKDMSERGLSDYGLKQALLKTVDRYVEATLKLIIDETPVFGPPHPQTAIYKNDLVSALRQQVKGGE